jgi:purine-binding chemotaxis protein CheW
MSKPKPVRTEIDWAQARQRLADVQLDDHARPTPERAQRVLMQRAALLARLVGSAVPTEAPLELLQFKLGNELCAIEVSWVREVLRSTPLTRLPGGPPHLLGITNLRGDILLAFDLRQLLRGERCEISDNTRVLVLGQENAELCLRVDAVLEIRNVSLDAILDPIDAGTRNVHPCLRGVTSDALVVLDAGALLADAQLFVGDADDRAVQPVHPGNEGVAP